LYRTWVNISKNCRTCIIRLPQENVIYCSLHCKNSYVPDSILIQEAVSFKLENIIIVINYNQVQPITYIQNVLEHTTWAPLLTTPAHPEYSSVHAVISAATAEAITALFGNIGSFTDHTYDYLGFAPRTFSSFRAIGIDAGNSRLYAGIHYQPSIDAGLVQGRKVSANILSRLRLIPGH
jgi:hypothetical protein